MGRRLTERDCMVRCNSTRLYCSTRRCKCGQY
uniref:Uncharacterized protein n=1 Tax=Siphoviridae sp. cthHz3 TaxID=2825614 RepID=A0A8S5UYI1_9CAUD|nr:MAG TPA: hypothetical protein [Siphoviridae sp. cthHz3]DAL75733.1 MAG TPA: hypothetical protein [Caudoviricetes sp.]DAL97612.1 MAG TPA: hypothetical protein [Caudoviricetes sp.]DAZ24930.1 MAG TPA: hypothetical protein [Caudoviricetes sp.]